MSIFADAARVITNLSSLGSQLIGVDANLSILSADSAPSGEQLAAIATGMTGDFGGGLAGGAKMLAPGVASGVQTLMTRDRAKVMQLRGAAYEAAYEKHCRGIYRVSQTTDKFKDIGAKTGNIILWTLNVVEVLELLTGLGPPCDGGDLKAGSAQFVALCAQLASAVPDDGWQGSGSAAYVERSADLQAIAQAMAELDLKLADLVRDQAAWVDHMRLAFSILKPNLVVAVGIEFAMRWVMAPAGELAAKVFAITVSGLALAAAAAFIGTLLGMSIENAQKANSLADDYEGLAAGTHLTGAAARGGVDAAGESAVSGFEGVGPAGPRVFLGARADGDERRAKGESEASEAPDGSPEGSPDLTLGPMPPSLAQLIHMSGQPSAVFDQTTAPAQRATARSRQALERKTPDESVPAADAEVAEAGVGAQAGERAPVEAAAGDAERARGARSDR